MNIDTCRCRGAGLFLPVGAGRRPNPNLVS